MNKKLAKIKEEVVGFVKSITIEPFIFLLMFGIGILAGAEVNTNLMLWKICAVTLGYNETACENLTAEENDEIESATQKRLNDYEIIDTYISGWPAIVYCLVAGGLSDIYGRKPLLFLPIFGAVLGSVVRLIHLIFIRELPLEFLYLGGWYSWLGGSSLYYLGIYGYGADITTDQERAARYARFDGVETLSYMFGSFLSPYVFELGGNYASYITELAFTSIATCYLLFIVKESKQRAPLADQEAGKGAMEVKEPSEGDQHKSFKDKAMTWLNDFVWIPLKETYLTVMKKREGNKRAFILALLFIYAMYWTGNGFKSSQYLYFLKVIEGFTGKIYSQIQIYNQLGSSLLLLFVVPYLTNKLLWHEATLGTLTNGLCLIGYIIKIFAGSVFPDLYISYTFSMANIIVYSVTRSQFTRVVGKDEVGKIFSAVALLAAITPLFSSPIGKKLYNATIDTFPGKASSSDINPFEFFFEKFQNTLLH